MSQVIATALIMMLMWSLKQFEWLEELGGPLTPSTMTVGFILLIAYMAGKLASRYRLPKITGYMIVGVVVGPYVLDLVSHEMTEQLQLINGLALSLIAITAGGELKIDELKPLWKSVLAITFMFILVLWIVFIAFAFAAYPWMPFLEDPSWRSILVVGMILGTLAAASSPAVAMAIINECEAKGVVTKCLLCVTVLKDIFVITLFSIVVTFGKALIKPDTPLDLNFLAMVSFEIVLSIGVGVLLGLLISLYLHVVNRENTLFLLFVCFLSAKLSIHFHLEPALVALSAGFFMENTTPERGYRLVHAIERGSLPVYTLFFCLTGAVIDLEALKSMWILALVVVALRLAALYGATYAGTRIGKGPDGMKQFGWLGFVAQAGVSLGLAAMLLRGFPEWGAGLQTLLIAVIGINLLIGPIGTRWALIRSGEAKI